MHIKLPFDTRKLVCGEARIEIGKPVEVVFSYIGENFFDNYPKWAAGVEDFEPLDGNEVFVGARAKQTRVDNGSRVESTFTITDYQPCSKLIFQGINAPYKHSYLLDEILTKQPTCLTFRFELLELDIFMRPFEKLIRLAIEDGAETTVENIKKLIDLDDKQ